MDTTQETPPIVSSDHLDCVDYLKNLLNIARLPGVVDQVCKNIVASKLKFDTIAFRGLSGALICPLVALRLGKEMVVVRKNTSDTHSSHAVEGYRYARRYIVIDDCICTGETIRALHAALRNRPSSADAELVGIFLYEEKYAYEFTLGETTYGPDGIWKIIRPPSPPIPVVGMDGPDDQLKFG